MFYHSLLQEKMTVASKERIDRTKVLPLREIKKVPGESVIFIKSAHHFLRDTLC